MAYHIKQLIRIYNRSNNLKKKSSNIHNKDKIPQNKICKVLMKKTLICS